MPIDTLGLAVLFEHLNEPCECENHTANEHECHRRLIRWWRLDDDPNRPLPAQLPEGLRQTSDEMPVAYDVFTLWHRLSSGGIATSTRERYLREIRSGLVTTDGKHCCACGEIGGRLVLAARTKTSTPVLMCKRCQNNLLYIECA